MPTETYYKHKDDGWVEAQAIHTHLGGSWRELRSMWEKSPSGDWRKVYRAIDPFDPDVSISITENGASRLDGNGRTGDNYQFTVSVSSNGNNETNRVGFVRFLSRYKHQNPEDGASNWSNWKGVSSDSSSPYIWDTLFSNEDKKKGSGTGKIVDYEIKAEVTEERISSVLKETGVITIRIDDTNDRPTLGISMVDSSQTISVGDAFDLEMTMSDDLGLKNIVLEANYDPNGVGQFQEVINPIELNGALDPSSRIITQSVGQGGEIDFRAKATDIAGRVGYSGTKTVDVQDIAGPVLTNQGDGVTDKWEVLEGNVEYRTFKFKDETSLLTSDVVLSSGATAISVDRKGSISENHKEIDIKFAPSSPFGSTETFTISATDGEGNTSQVTVEVEGLLDNDPPYFEGYKDENLFSKSLTSPYKGNTASLSPFTAKDPNEDDSNINASLKTQDGSSLPDGLSDVSTNKNKVELQIENALDAGNYDLELEAIDSHGYVSTVPFTLTVDYADSNPIMAGPVDVRNPQYPHALLDRPDRKEDSQNLYSSDSNEDPNTGSWDTSNSAYDMSSSVKVDFCCFDSDDGDGVKFQSILEAEFSWRNGVAAVDYQGDANTFASSLDKIETNVRHSRFSLEDLGFAKTQYVQTVGVVLDDGSFKEFDIMVLEISKEGALGHEPGTAEYDALIEMIDGRTPDGHDYSRYEDADWVAYHITDFIKNEIKFDVEFRAVGNDGSTSDWETSQIRIMSNTSREHKVDWAAYENEWGIGPWDMCGSDYGESYNCSGSAPYYYT